MRLEIKTKQELDNLALYNLVINQQPKNIVGIIPTISTSNLANDGEFINQLSRITLKNTWSQLDSSSTIPLSSK